MTENQTDNTENAKEDELPESFEFQGVTFKMYDGDGGWRPEKRVDQYPFMYVRYYGKEGSEYEAFAKASNADDRDLSEILFGRAVASTPQEALKLAMKSYAATLKDKAEWLLEYAEEVRKRADLTTVDPTGDSPEWDGGIGEAGEWHPKGTEFESDKGPTLLLVIDSLASHY
jgi:hypothetical protein